MYTDDTGVKRYGRYLSKITSGTKQCIVSFFINKDANPKIGISDSDADPTTWTNISVDESYVYNFTMEMTPDTVTLSNTYSKYQGNYYIRTDGADGGWHDYQKNEDNRLTYFTWRDGEFYNYYWVKELSANSDGKMNVRACVANDYNSNLAGIIISDLYTDEHGDVRITPQDSKLHLRFGYSPNTNHFERAMLTDASQNDDFLNIVGANIYQESACTTPLSTAGAHSKLTDMGNYMYEKNVYLKMPNTSTSIQAQLQAKAHNGQTQFLFGRNKEEVNARTILTSGTTPGVYQIRSLYDFKTNRFLFVWVPIEANIDDINIQADMLVIRHENDDATQLKSNQVQGVHQVYFAMEFEQNTGANRPVEEQYFFSLPYNCKISDISGIPGYMSIWGIQRYRGDLRAEKGWFIETPTFWEWMDPTDELQAGEGYVLILDKSAAPWNTYGGQTAPLYLYFPSSGDGSTVIVNQEMTHEYPDQPCTITREQRDIQDSNWKMIGVNGYRNAAVISASEQSSGWHEYPNFRYDYSYRERNGKWGWGYEAVDGKSSIYKSFFGYMVQFAGTIQWSPLQDVPRQILARRNAVVEDNISYQLKLEVLNSQAEKEDQTFIVLESGATTTFDQNKDLNKIFNPGSNIYTLSEGVAFAGNSLPVGECIVPLGLSIAQEGEYTICLPEVDNDVIVELIDDETQSRTNLSYFDYTTNLSAGTIEKRFAIHIQPRRADVSTNFEGMILDDDSRGNKFIINGRLYLQKNGLLYDAQGHCVKDIRE